MIKLVFSSKRNIGSYIIRLFTWSSWSHVSYLDDEGFITEAIGFEGVRRVPLSEVVKDYNKFAIVEFKNCSYKQKQEFEQYLFSQIGKGYDYLAVIGIGLKKKWQDKSRWECSELIGDTLKKAQINIFRPEESLKITPQQLWQQYPDGSTNFIRNN
jgi:uncharacterized protein YycO